MTDREAIAHDWKAVGDDMRVAMGMQKPGVPHKVSSLEAFIAGIQTLNPFGTRIKHR